MSSGKSLRKRIFDIIQIGNKEDIPSRAFDIFISAVIILNILAMFLETFDFPQSFIDICKITELVTVIIFCIEYVLRIWTAGFLYPHKNNLVSIGKFMLSFDGIIDLLTILPFFFLDGMVVFRMLRVVRIFHLFRINAQYDSFNLIKDVLLERKRQLISSFFIILIMMLAASLAMYGAEHEAQPEVFDNAFSGLWWGTATLLTIGYGDIYPITITGKIIAMISSFLGVCAVAVPTGIISAGFFEKFRQSENSEKKLHDIHEVGEVLCDKKSGLTGKTIYDIRSDYDVQIYLIIRGELSIVPTDNIRIEENDILIVNSRNLVKEEKKEKKSGKKH